MVQDSPLGPQHLVTSPLHPETTSGFWQGLSSCEVVRVGKGSPEWQWLKDKEGKTP